MSNLSYDLLLVGHLNIQSLVPKINDLRDYIKKYKFDVLAISETWLNSSIDSNNLTIDNYILIRQDRNTGSTGGGVLLYLNCKLKFQVINISSDIEQLFVRILYNLL